METYTREILESLTRKELIEIGLKNNIEDPDFLQKNDLIKEILNSQHDQKEEKIIPLTIDKNTEIKIELKEKKKEEILDINYNYYTLKDLYEKLNPQENTDIHVPKLLTLYKGIKIEEQDCYKIKTETLDLYELVLLENLEGYCGFMQLIENGEEKLLVGESENIDFDKLAKNAFFNMIFFKNSDRKFFESIDVTESLSCYKVECDVDIKELKINDRRLCIDFGTSNTSLGTYNENGEPEIVEFIDITNEKKKTKVTPTIVWIEDCSDKDNIKYLFGYEAKKKIEESNFRFKNSVYYEIKKWICEDIEAIERVNDANGKRAEVKRRDIIKAYLLYVINKAETNFKQRFKLIHMTAPVKMKEKYIETYKKMLADNNYEVRKSQLSLDEGIAIIYNYIKKKMKEVSKNQNIENYPKDENGKDKERVIIIDAGGGTTDLASCQFSFEKTSKGYKLDIETNFEDGNSNFGGNNITYRIMQYIKIKLAHYYDSSDHSFSNIVASIEDLLPSKSSILENIDTNIGVENVYKKLEETYKQAGEIIPTDYAISSKFSSRQQEAVLKRNYYVLWEAAEILKKEFFKSTDLLMIDFKSEDTNNRKIKMPKLEKLDLSVVENMKLVEKKELPALSISIKEIEGLVYGEIYNVLKTLLSETESQRLLDDYDSFRLSGQTCKISLFAELLKEFIPGKKLRSSLLENEKEEKRTNGKDSLDLKLQCLEGSIHYIFDNERGILANQRLSSKKPSLKYKVKLDRGEEREILSKELIAISEYDITKAAEAKFNIYDQADNYIKSQKYEFKFGTNYKEITLNEILEKSLEKFKENLRDDLERVDKNSRVIITVPTEDGFGFKVLDVLKNEEKNFFLWAEETFNFEKSLSESTFFNGKR